MIYELFLEIDPKNAYEYTSKYMTALHLFEEKQYEKSYKILEDIKNKMAPLSNIIIYILCEQSNILLQCNHEQNIQLACQYYKEAIDITVLNKGMYNFTYVYLSYNLGTLYGNINSFIRASEYYAKSFYAIENIQDVKPIKIADLCVKIAKELHKYVQFEDAMLYYMKAIQLLKSYNNLYDFKIKIISGMLEILYKQSNMVFSEYEELFDDEEETPVKKKQKK